MSNLTYTRIGDYYIPNLVVPEQPDKPVGKYGRMRQHYLQEHRPLLYNELVIEGKLFHHLADVDEAANRRMETLMPQYMRAAGVTEKLKAADPMKWVGLMNNCKSLIDELILSELIYE